MGTSEIRLACGSPTERRSTIWKFFVCKNDAYVLTRMLAKDVKLSLHPSGDCQWSGTSAWVLKDRGRKNRDRHFARWSMPDAVSGKDTSPVAQIVFPETELRHIAPGDDLGGVNWIPSPPAGEAYAVACSFFPPSKDEPKPDRAPYIHMKSLLLEDGRWFVLRLTQVHVSQVEIDAACSEMLAKAGADFRMGPDHRAIFVTKGKEVGRNIIEVSVQR